MPHRIGREGRRRADGEAMRRPANLSLAISILTFLVGCASGPRSATDCGHHFAGGSGLLGLLGAMGLSIGRPALIPTTRRRSWRIARLFHRSSQSPMLFSTRRTSLANP